MKTRPLHSWDVPVPEAIKIQNTLRHKIILTDLPTKIRHVAGIDVSGSKKSNIVWAGAVVLSYPELENIEEKWAKGVANFPYIPGFLSFREIPVILEALKLLETEPDLFFCDGQGIAHLRGLGLAAHLGLLIEKPTIGCAKKRLVGSFSKVGKSRGDFSTLFYEGREVGAVLRTRINVKPVFISPGYAIKIPEAVRMVLNCGGGFRIPEPIRRAHLLVTKLRQREEIS